MGILSLPAPGDTGLLPILSASQVVAAQDAAIERARPQSPAPVVDNLAGFVRRRWEAARDAKQPHERRMLDALRRRKGEYDPAKLAAIRAAGGSEIFIGITGQKCRDAEAWIRDIDTPAGETPWAIDPSPVPELPPDEIDEIRREVLMRAQAMTAAGMALEMSPEDYQDRIASRMRDEMQEEAKERARRMADLVETQMQAAKWNRVFRAFVGDLVTFPAACIRGPVIRRRKRMAWVQDGADWRADVADELRPEFDRVSPLDLYPSADATDMARSYMCEVMSMTRSDLAAMIGVPSFSEAAVRAALDEYDRGGARGDWLAYNDSERERVEGRDSARAGSDTDTMRALSYWGSVPGKWLTEWGLAGITDPQAEYQVNVWLVGRHAVRAMLNDDPLGRDPYHITSFARVPGSFWGSGVPDLCEDAQDGANAAARALANNVAFASGPLTEMDVSRFPNGIAPPIQPWQRFEVDSYGVQRTDPAVRFYQAEMHGAELIGVIEFWLDKADQVTGIPRYMHGDQEATGAATTMGGLSMLMAASAKGLKDVLGNIDADVLEPAVERMIEHNNRYSTDPAVKGDLHARALGGNSMMMRERQAQMRSEFLDRTNNPNDMQIMGIEGRAELLREAVKPLELSDPEKVVPDEDALQQRLMQQQAAQQQAAMQQQAMSANAQQA